MQVLELGGEKGRRRWCLVYETGDTVMDRLQEFARAWDVRAAQFTALGAFQEATLAFFDVEARRYDDIPVPEQVEVTSLVGDVGVADGAPMIHAHCVLGRRDGSAVTGHLVEATVRPTLELFLHEGMGTLERRLDEATGLKLIRR